jgi:hypothetical protein
MPAKMLWQADTVALRNDAAANVAGAGDRRSDDVRPEVETRW